MKFKAIFTLKIEIFSSQSLNYFWVISQFLSKHCEIGRGDGVLWLIFDKDLHACTPVGINSKQNTQTKERIKERKKHMTVTNWFKGLPGYWSDDLFLGSWMVLVNILAYFLLLHVRAVLCLILYWYQSEICSWFI